MEDKTSKDTRASQSNGGSSVSEVYDYGANQTSEQLDFESSGIAGSVSRNSGSDLGKTRLTRKEWWTVFWRKNKKMVTIFSGILVGILAVNVILAAIISNLQQQTNSGSAGTEETSNEDIIEAEDEDNNEVEDETAESESYYQLPDELNADNLSEEDEVTRDAILMDQDPDSSEEDVESYYDRKITEATSAGNTGLATNIIIEKINYIVLNENNCKKAEEYADSIDLNAFSNEERRYLASYILSAAISCEDDGFEQKWENI